MVTIRTQLPDIKFLFLPENENAVFSCHFVLTWISMKFQRKFEEKCKNFQKYPTRVTSEFLEYYDAELCKFRICTKQYREFFHRDAPIHTFGPWIFSFCSYLFASLHMEQCKWRNIRLSLSCIRVDIYIIGNSPDCSMYVLLNLMLSLR